MKSYFTNTGIILRVMLLFVWIMPFRSQGAENPMAAAPPTWSVNPLDFEFNMNILIQVQYNGVDNNNPNNIVGVFVGNELRGVATPTMAGGIAYYFVKVYSNTYSGENLNFKVYYAPDDQVYQTMETANFLHNGSIGDINNPFYLDINPNMDLPPELAPFDEVTTLDNIPFDPIALNDYLISADGDPVTWSVQSGPNFTAIIVNDVLTVSHVPGTLMLPYSEDVVITATENNPPNNFSVSATVQFTVLEDYGPPEWEVTPDNIPDQTIFKGDQFSNFDLDNHLNYAGPCHEFDFDVFPYAGSDPDPAWPVVPPGANPMTVIARPLFADVQLAGPGAKLAAFVGGNLAGWADVQGFSPNVHYDLQLANVGSGPITFRLYHADNQFLYEKQSTLNYTSGGTTGSIANPYKVQYSPLVPLLNSSGQVLISIVDTSWLGSYPVDFIVWDCDYPVQRRATDQAVFTIVADARPVFTSENSKNYQENACYVLYDAETADPNYNEGNGLTYSLDGGADIARFEIDPTTGILSWVTGFIPDFETPQDDDLNNKYQVNIKVTNDDNLSATLALTITVTDQATEPFVAMINNGDPLICNTGGATLTASGGVAYSWSTGSMFNSIDVPAGDYTVTVTSAGACTLTASVTVADEPSIIAAGNNNTLCIGAAIQLSSTPAGGTQPYASFAWTGPDNFASSQEDPAGFPATLAAAGDYVVVVTDDAGCSVSASKTIDVSNNTQPAITASVAADPVCQDSPVNLSSDPMGGSGIYTQFNWSGPNGYLGVVQNPPAFNATLLSAGTYQVIVTDDQGCKGTATVSLSVNEQPMLVVDNGLPLDSISEGQNLDLTATASGGSGSGYIYSWTGPAGFSSSDQNPSRLNLDLTHSGLYIATVTDGNGCTRSDTTEVTVMPCPGVTATPGPVCVGGDIDLNSFPTSGALPYTAFSWEGPNGYSSDLQDPAAFPISPANLGTYTVTVTDHLGCTATSSTTAEEHVNPSITATNSTLPSGICEGEIVSLFSTPSGGSGLYPTFDWVGVDGYVASIEDPASFTTSLASAGLYQVKVTDSQGCTATATTTVIVNGNPTITASSNSTVCLGQDLDLQSDPQGGATPYTFDWTGPTGFSGMVQNPSRSAPLALPDAGIYSVTLTDMNGCSATASTPVSVSATAAPDVMASSNSPVCSGDALMLSATATGGSGVYTSYIWEGPANYSASVQNPVRSPAYKSEAGGSYTVTVTDSHNCNASASVTVMIDGPDLNPSNNGPLCIEEDVVLMAGGSGGAGWTYSWVGPNGFSSNQQNPAPFPATLVAAGDYTVTVTADDGGCTGSVNVDFTSVEIAGGDPPVIVCPPDATVTADANCSGEVGEYDPISVTDDCPDNLTVTQSPDPNTMFSGLNQVQTISLTADDGAGNTASCAFNVTLEDQSAPAITCPANTTVSADANCGGELGAYDPESLSDNCDANPVVTQNPDSNTMFSGLGDVQTITLTAEDASSNTSSCSFTATLEDTTPPDITCPADITIFADANCSGTLDNYSPVTLSDNCSANPTVTQSPAAGTMLSGHNDSELVTLTADDGNGNASSCDFTVTLIDDTPPMITCPTDATVSADANCSGVVGSYSPASVSDNCNANPTVTQSPDPSTPLMGHNDFQIVTLTADDGNGNSASCDFTVTLIDDTPPVITCPADVTLSADANCSGVVGSYSPVTVSDNCSANPTVTQSPDPSTPLMGHNDSEVVTLTADDGNGNSASCDFTVTLIDDTPPVITCPADVTLSADANCSGVVGPYSPASVSDNCNTNPTVTQSPDPSTPLMGHNDSEVVTLTADDGNGNSASCDFTVTLIDDTPPVITCPVDITLSADANCSGEVGSYSPASVSDNCNANPTVTQSPDPSTLLSGHNDFELVTLTGDDGNGNAAFCDFTVTLIDDTPPVITCPADITLSADANCSGEVGSYSPASVSDNCSVNPTVTQSPDPSTLLSGHNDFELVTLTGDDGNGNAASCDFTVTLIDDTPPVITCPADVSILADANCSGEVGSYSPVSLSDNCSANPTVTQSPDPSTLLSGHNDFELVTLTGDDGNGNAASCDFTVTLIDDTAPVITCKAATVPLDANGTGSITPTDVFDTGSDNCGTVNLVSVVASTFTCADLGANTVTLTANDGNGNTSTCTATVTVVDNIPPTMICMNATLNLDASGNATLVVANIDNGSSDNCTLSTLTLSQTAYTCANLGANVVTLTGTDQSGNSASCTASVIVQDQITPTALCKNAMVNLDANGNVTVVPANVDNGSSDNCSFTMSVTPSTFTCADIGAHVITLKATDSSNNMNTCMATVTVKDVTPPTAVCDNITTYLDIEGLSEIDVLDVSGNSTDNCSIVSRTISRTDFNCSDLGAPINVFITLTDQSGNVSNCTGAVTVSDTMAPEANCFDVTIQLVNGFATVHGAQLASQSEDNCAVWSFNPATKVYTVADLGDNYLDITVSDFSGNSDVCTSVVTVVMLRPEGRPKLLMPDVVTDLILHPLKLKAFPNPSAGDVQVEFELPEAQDFHLQVVDMAGQSIHLRDETGAAGKNSVLLKRELFNPGIYFLNVRSKNSGANKRLIIRE